DRRDTVDELAQRVMRRRRRVEQEPAEPLRLVILQRDGGFNSRVAPDAEADVPLVEVVVQVARDTQRLVLLARPASEELYELQSLRRGAPRAVAKRVAHRTSASRAVVHDLPRRKRK